MTEKKWAPLFKRISVDRETTAAKITKTQDEFEKFWKSLNRACAPNSEKTLALRKMQEACMWLCRAIAIDGYNPPEDKSKKDHSGEVFSRMIKNEIGATLIDCNSQAATLAPKNKDNSTTMIGKTIVAHKKPRSKSILNKV